MFSLERAGRWLLESGIQDVSGGVARYYRTDLQRNAPISTEITGYACAALLFLARRTGLADYREAALRAGRFIAECAWDERAGALPFEWPAGASPRAYFFDCGIVARALTALWRDVGDAEFRDVARACASSMLGDFRDGSSWHPVLELPSKAPVPHENRWSRRPGCYQLKAALAWLETGYDAAYHENLAGALADHEAFLPGADEPALVVDRLHAYLYFLEGLLPAVSRQECREAMAAGIGRVAELLRTHRDALERSDVYAQLLPIRLYADRLGVVPLDTAAAEEEAGELPQFQIASRDRRTDGAVAFGRKGGELLPYANPVSTSFCIQALEMWRDYRGGRFTADWRELI